MNVVLGTDYKYFPISRFESTRQAANNNPWFENYGDITTANKDLVCVPNSITSINIIDYYSVNLDYSRQLEGVKGIELVSPLVV